MSEVVSPKLGAQMTYAKISLKYQVVIPKNVRESVGLKPGQKVMITAKDNVIRMIPIVDIKKLRGSLKGMPRS